MTLPPDVTASIHEIKELARPLATSAFWLSEVLKVSAIYLVAYLSAQLVIRRNVRVNYTRKINHFGIFFVPMLLALLFDYERNAVTSLTSGLIFLVALAPFLAPVRRRLKIFATMFRSLDRPEDRPHTLVWLTTQVVAGYLVIFPMLLILDTFGKPFLIMIPILINAIGDGLAEPVGVRFGRRRYQVRALFTNKRYTRSIEGSACVFASAVAATLLFAGSFTTAELIWGLVIIPVVSTLAEAWSPHTWDTPFIFLAGGASVLVVLAVF